MTGTGGENGSDAELTRLRGLPLLDALAVKLPTARARADVGASLAEALATEAGAEGVDLIREAARLQEIGKVYVPGELLRRPPGELLESERRTLAGHYEHGHALALGAGVPEQACAWILHARERWDGAGPTGLSGAEIPAGSRIIAVTREYLDAPLQPGAEEYDPRAAALLRLQRLSGSLIDPDLAAIAIRLAAADA